MAYTAPGQRYSPSVTAEEGRVMLILARKAGESIRIGKRVKVTVIRVRKNEVRLGLDAPREIRIRSADRDGEQIGRESEPESDDS